MSENEINRLPPSMRKNYRYINFRIYSDADIELGDCVDGLWKSFLGYLGTKEVAEADIWIIGNQFDADQQSGIVKVSKNSVQDIRAAMTLCNNLGGEKVSIKVEKISGSIKKFQDS